MPLQFERIGPYRIKVLVVDDSGNVKNEVTIGVVIEGTYELPTASTNTLEDHNDPEVTPKPSIL